MYLNIRGIKSKFDSLLTKIEEIEPTIICLTETFLLQKEKCEIEGYEVWPSLVGGLLIAVKNEVKNICTIVEDKKEVGESMWVSIDNSRTKIRLGLIYAPQESRTKKDILKEMYTQISDQLLIAKEKQQRVVLLGDFNCKIGEEIKGNRPDVTKGGKLLLKLADVNKLCILNKSDQCFGLWTRTDEKSKSVIDYVLIDQDSDSAVDKMVIDEAKEFAPKSVDSQYSDHNAILAKFNWFIPEQSNRENRKIVTKKGWKRIGRGKSF